MDSFEVPNELRSPFFASFINGNHAAYFMACGDFFGPLCLQRNPAGLLPNAVDYLYCLV